MANKQLGKYATIGAGLGATSWVVSQVYRFAGIGASGVQSSLEFAPITEGLKQSIQQGLSTDLASKIIGLLNGVIQGGMMGFFTLVLAGILVGIAGGFIVDFLTTIPMFKALEKGIMVKLMSITVVGTIVIGAVVSTMAGTPELPVVSAVITMVLYSAVVAFAYGILSNLTQKTQLKAMFPDPR